METASEVDVEELQDDYNDKINEIAELRGELKAANMDVQKLRLRLQGAVNSGRVQKAVPLPNARSEAIDQKAEEIRTMFCWLAEHVDLTRSKFLDVGFKVPVGGRGVHLERVAQWPLASEAGHNLLFSVPANRATEVEVLIAAIRTVGAMDDESLQRLTASWEVVLGELATSVIGGIQAEPAVLIAQRDGPQGMLVASWPTREALDAFEKLHEAQGGAPRLGERVEVEYHGQWFTGVLHQVGPTKAAVRCDVDAPGVLTVARLSQVRKLGEPKPDAAPSRG